jgi:hypothetical protein
MNNVLFTDVTANGEPRANVMAYTNLDAGTLAAAMRTTAAVEFSECYEIPDRDVQFHHVDESWHLSESEECKARQLAAN